MTAATWPRERTRLLHIDPVLGTFGDAALPALLREGDVLVVNDAATIPASLATDGLELRLLAEIGDGLWRAVLFGDGDWRTKTEHRPPPREVSVGEWLAFGELGAEVVAREGARLVTIQFAQRGAALWRALYRAGKPVQYAHVRAPLALWHVQTAYATRPWAAEAPSAGWALSWELIIALKRAGVVVARVTHAAGLSSTGDAELDARLPLAERYDIPAETVEAIEKAERVIAVGTTVTRALEGAHPLIPGAGITDLVLGPETKRRVVDGLITGVHDVESSHFRLLESFAPRELLMRAHAYAAANGYLGHEFGDFVAII